MKTLVLIAALSSVVVGVVPIQDEKGTKSQERRAANPSLVGLWVQFLYSPEVDQWMNGGLYRVEVEDGRLWMSIESERGKTSGVGSSSGLSNVQFDGKTWAFDSAWPEGRSGHFVLRKVSSDLFDGYASDASDPTPQRNLWMRFGQQSLGHASGPPSLIFPRSDDEIPKRIVTSDRDTVVSWISDQDFDVLQRVGSAAIKNLRSDLARVLAPYTILAVADGRTSLAKDDHRSGPKMEYRSRSEIVGTLTVRAPGGVELHAVDDSEIEPGIRRIVETVERSASGLPEVITSNLHLFYFRAPDKSGAPGISSKSDGVLTVDLDGRHFVWHLPLSSAVPAKTCPACKETLSGSFQFCPWDGTKLPPMSGR